MDPVYTPSRLHKKVTIAIQHVQKDMKDTLYSVLKKMEGKCCEEGFVEPDSIQIEQYSSGTIRGTSIVFDVIVKCNIAYPVSGQLYDAKIDSITKAGLKCRLDRSISPFVVFVARDHHYDHEKFSDVKEGDIIVIKVIGQRFVLDDDYIAVIAGLHSVK